MKRFAVLVCLSLFLAGLSLAQTPAPACSAPLDFCESAWTFNVVGGYSALSNATTNNGFVTEAGVRLATHWSIEGRYYMTASPSGKIFVAGPQFDYGLGHLVKPTSSFDTSNVDLFVHASPGIAWSSGTAADGTAINGATKFAFAIGGGADWIVPAAPNVTWRIFEVSYVRAPILPNGGMFIGNPLQVATGLRLVFGGQSTPAAAARREARKLRKQTASKYLRILTCD